MIGIVLGLYIYVACTIGSEEPSTDLLRIYHFDVDEADCTLLLSPGGVVVLFDCGDASWNSRRELDWVAPQIEQLLDGRALSYAVVSHLHVDHVGYVGYGGFWGLIERYGIRPGIILIRDYVAFPGNLLTKSYGLWCDYFDSDSNYSRMQTLALGEIIDLGDGVTLTVCSVDGNSLITPNTPETLCPVSENELSLGILISYGEYQEWIGGDLGGTSIERRFGPDCRQYVDVETSAAARIGDIEVLRVNHHGSAYSSNEVFLGNLDPEVSIISVGETKSHGHPDMDTLLRLASTSDVYATTRGNKDGPISTGALDLDAHPNVVVGVGRIVVETDGSSYWVNEIPYLATTPARDDKDGDGYFAEVDPDDSDAAIVPAQNVQH